MEEDTESEIVGIGVRILNTPELQTHDIFAVAAGYDHTSFSRDGVPFSCGCNRIRQYDAPAWQMANGLIALTAVCSTQLSSGHTAGVLRLQRLIAYMADTNHLTASVDTS